MWGHFNKPRRRSNRPCFGCNKVGHFIADCPEDVTSRKIYQNKLRTKNNSQKIFIVELRPFPPDLPKNRSRHLNPSLSRLPVRLCPARNARLARVRVQSRSSPRSAPARSLSLSLSFSFSFSLPFSFLFFFLFPFSLSLSPFFLSSAALPHARRAARRSPATALTPAAPRP